VTSIHSLSWAGYNRAYQFLLIGSKLFRDFGGKAYPGFFLILFIFKLEISKYVGNTGRSTDNFVRCVIHIRRIISLFLSALPGLRSRLDFVDRLVLQESICYDRRAERDTHLSCLRREPVLKRLVGEQKFAISSQRVIALLGVCRSQRTAKIMHSVEKCCPIIDSRL